MKRILFLVVVASLVSVPATAAWARGDGWELTQLPGNGHLVEHCGSAPVDVTWPVNQEYERTITLGDGTVLTQFTGRLIVRFVAPSDVTDTQHLGSGEVH